MWTSVIYSKMPAMLAGISWVLMYISKWISSRNPLKGHSIPENLKPFFSSSTNLLLVISSSMSDCWLYTRFYSRAPVNPLNWCSISVVLDRRRPVNLADGVANGPGWSSAFSSYSVNFDFIHLGVAIPVFTTFKYSIEVFRVGVGFLCAQFIFWSTSWTY